LPPASAGVSVDASKSEGKPAFLAFECDNGGHLSWKAPSDSDTGKHSQVRKGGLPPLLNSDELNPEAIN